MRRAVVLLLLAAAPTACGDEPRRPAVRTAAQFIDSIGVHVHMSCSDRSARIWSPKPSYTRCAT